MVGPVARPPKMRTPGYRELCGIMEEHGLWDLGSAAHSLCVWAWELTSRTELLPVEKGITVLTLQGCYEDYVNVGVSVPNMVLGTE